MKNFDKIKVKCEKCGIEYEIYYKSYKLNRRHLCKKCSGLERVTDLHKGNTKYFNDPKNVTKHSKLCREVWNDRSQEFKNKRISDLKKIGDLYRASVDFSSISSERMKKFFEDEKNRKNISNLMKNRWLNMSKVEKESATEHLVEYWKNINPEKLDKWFENILDGMIMNGVIKEGPSEKEFQNIIDNSNIFVFKYHKQYRSNIKHPDFDKLFPFNPITGGKYVNPYHIWDFFIEDERGDILIDIDGSIHNTGPGKVKYEGNDVEFSELINFNDSKRIYQTDGLHAYIIKAYNNKLEDNTEVLRLDDDKIILFKDLLSYLYLYNKLIV